MHEQIANQRTLKALEGIRVIDFGMGGAAPLATATLSDFGAEVIKIEPPKGDWSRTTPGLGTREFNRNKKGAAIDLKTEEGKALVHRLLVGADVMMESFRPGVMQRLGLGYEAVRRINPLIIYCSVTAYGQDGPWRDRGGVDGVLQAASGIMSVLGREGDEALEPMKVSFPVVDMTGGMLAAQGILVALLARDRHGVGQHVDLSLLEAAFVVQKSSLTRYLNSGQLPPRTGSRAPYATPNEAYRTADGYLMIAAYNPARWKAFCVHVLGRPEIEADPRFQTRQERQKHHRTLKGMIEDVLATRSTAEWLELCLAHDLLVAPINDYNQVLEMEQVKARNAVRTLTFPDGKQMRTVAPVPKLSETPGDVVSPYPEKVGEHTREILRSIGVDDEEIDRLAAQGVIGLPD